MNHLCVPAEEKSMLWVVKEGVPLSFVVYPLSEIRFHPQLFSSDLISNLEENRKELGGKENIVRKSGLR